MSSDTIVGSDREPLDNGEDKEENLGIVVRVVAAHVILPSQRPIEYKGEERQVNWESTNISKYLN